MGKLELLGEIVDSLPFATLVVTNFGSVAWWNKSAEQLYGWRSSEVLGRPNPTVPADRQDEFRAFEEIALTGKTLRVKSVRQRRDGTLLEVKATMLPMRTGSSEAKHILILHEPIGEPALEVSKHARTSTSEPRSANGHKDEQPSSALSRFTPRQREIVTLVARGYHNREIAKSLSVGEQQIKNYLRGIYREINVAHRAELVSWLNRQ
jgi:PAS domain S-box-containing protein